jgi:nucleotide-binding universal stress UspA family protein
MITIKKILVPTDFSHISASAIGYAISLAKDHGAEIIVLHSDPAKLMKEQFSEPYVGDGLVSPTGPPPVAVAPQPNVENLSETRKQILHNFLEQNLGPELLKAARIRPLVRFGKVVEEIVATVKEEQCDLIVMTSHASRFRRLLHGSVTEQVVRRAPCPVLTLLPSAEVRTQEDKRVPVEHIEEWGA